MLHMARYKFLCCIVLFVNKNPTVQIPNLKRLNFVFEMQSSVKCHPGQPLVPEMTYNVSSGTLNPTIPYKYRDNHPHRVLPPLIIVYTYFSNLLLSCTCDF